MKTPIIILSLSIACLLSLQSCRHKSGSKEPLVLTNESNTDGDASVFMKKAAPGGMMEVEAGTLAQGLAQSPQVKGFGAMMIRDHNKANKELKDIFAKKKLLVPSELPEEMQGHLKMLTSMKGAGFDKAYMQMMLKDHEEDIALFRSATTIRDRDVSNFAKETLPVLQKHLDSAKAISSGLK